MCVGQENGAAVGFDHTGIAESQLAKKGFNRMVDALNDAAARVFNPITEAPTVDGDISLQDAGVLDDIEASRELDGVIGAIDISGVEYAVDGGFDCDGSDLSDAPGLSRYDQSRNRQRD